MAGEHIDTKSPELQPLIHDKNVVYSGESTLPTDTRVRILKTTADDHDDNEQDLSLAIANDSLFDFDVVQAWEEVKSILSLGFPIGLARATRYGQYLTDSAFLGHLGHNSIYLSAASISQLFITMTGTILIEFARCINVLSSQAYGAGNYNLVSQWYQLGSFILVFMTIPTLIFWNFIDVVLLCSDDFFNFGRFYDAKDIAQLAVTYARWMMLSIYFHLFFVCTRMYFTSQSIVLPSTVVCMVFFVVNILFNYICIFLINLGFIGSPIATSLTRIFQCISYVVYMFFLRKYHLSNYDNKDTWYNSFSSLNNLKETFGDWSKYKRYIKIGIPQVFCAIFEDWQVQVIMLFVVWLDSENNSDYYVSSFSTMVNLILVFNAFVMGIADGLTVRIGNALGNGNYNGAKYISKVGIVLGLVFGIIIGSIIGVFGKYFGELVSNDKNVINIYAQLSPIIGGVLVFLTMFAMQVGILLGQARTLALAICALVSSWLISVPLAYVFSLYLNLGISGIWYGLIIGYIIFWFLTLLVIFNSDWKQLSEEAIKRSQTKKSITVNRALQIEE